VPANGTQTALIGGTKTTGNTLTITVYDAGPPVKGPDFGHLQGPHGCDWQTQPKRFKILLNDSPGSGTMPKGEPQNDRFRSPVVLNAQLFLLFAFLASRFSNGHQYQVVGDYQNLTLGGQWNGWADWVFPDYSSTVELTASSSLLRTAGRVIRAP
jgi:hypothetical protein